MKKILAVTTLLLVIGNGYAQKEDASKYASAITATELQKHLAVIAGAEMEGRETASPAASVHIRPAASRRACAG